MTDLRVIPGPNDDAYAVDEAHLAPRHVWRESWTKAGAWKWRQFGREVQLSNAALPWLRLDLFRGEAEELYRALGDVLKQPMVLPYRISRWERIRQWWLRAIWKRKHYALIDAATKALTEDVIRRGPWGKT